MFAAEAWRGEAPDRSVTGRRELPCRITWFAAIITPGDTNNQIAVNKAIQLKAEEDRNRLRVLRQKKRRGETLDSAQQTELETLEKVPKSYSGFASLRQLLMDVISDDTEGVAIYRFQMLAWTIALGFVFIFKVAVDRSIPTSMLPLSAFSESVRAPISDSSCRTIRLKPLRADRPSKPPQRKANPNGKRLGLAQRAQRTDGRNELLLVRRFVERCLAGEADISFAPPWNDICTNMCLDGYGPAASKIPPLWCRFRASPAVASSLRPTECNAPQVSSPFTSHFSLFTFHPSPLPPLRHYGG